METNNKIFKLMAVAAGTVILIFFLILLIAGRNKVRDESVDSIVGNGRDYSTDSAISATLSIIEAGKKIYRQHCASCHGESGGGDGPAASQCVPPPADFANGRMKFGSSPEQVYRSITNGITGTMMASYRFLDDNDRWAAAHYIRTLMQQ